jgi:hypothetical protein
LCKQSEVRPLRELKLIFSLSAAVWLSVFKMPYNVKVLCVVGDFGNGFFNLPPKLNSSSNAQLTTIAPIAQNTCYGLPFFHNIALGELCKTHN